MSSAIFLDHFEDVDRREAGLFGLAFIFLSLTSFAISLSPVVRDQTWQAVGSRWQHLIVLPVWLLCAAFVRKELRRVCPGRDPMLLPVGFLLAGWGMLLIWRLTPGFGVRQTGWFILGTAAMVVIIRLPTNLRWLRRYRYLWLITGMTLTALTLLLGTNPSGVEPRLWLGCCGVYFQPSEPLRLLLIAFLASYLADRLAFRWSGSHAAWISTLAPLLAIWGFSTLILFLQKDLGTGSLFLAILAVLLYLAYGKWQVVWFAAGAALVGSFTGYRFIDVVQNRFQAWINPWQDPIGGSYQVVQSLIAIASGGVFGRGPGLGSPGFVPVVHSDLVFAAILEEWGFLGGIGLIGVFAVLVARGLRAAARQQEPFTMLLAAGLAISFGVQAFVILGGSVRLLPLAGITLPFVSYGGSSLVTSLVGLTFLIVLSNGRASSELFARPIRNIHIGMTLAWSLLALVLGWWSLYRNPVLTARTDNPRRARSELYNRRGAIVDRSGDVLAHSIGERGDYNRTYPAPWAVAIVGFNSPSYGQVGIERSMDETLRGEQGYPAFSLWWSHWLYGHPPPGLDIRLTIDGALQKQAVESLEGYQGAMVVLNTDTGAILAMASSPGYDPNRLDDEWQSLIQRDDAPLLNRATQGQYQPGMVLAPFTLAWAQSLGIADVDAEVDEWNAPVAVQAEEISCLETAFRSLDITYGRALSLGCPQPFAELGLTLGYDQLASMVDIMGFLDPPALRIDQVEPRSFPNLENRQDLRLAAIGQGSLTVSPLQVARAFSMVLRGGRLPGLQLVHSYSSPEGFWQEFPVLQADREIIPHTVSEAIRDALLDESTGMMLYSVEALAGSGGQRIAWSLVADMDRDPALVIVVVLENADRIQAQRLATRLLAD